MSFFRFPENIPTVFYTIIWVLLLAVIIFVAPFFFTQDLKLLILIKDEELVSNFSEFINPHLILLKIAFELTNLLNIDNYFLFRLLNFIYLGLLILVTYKIIKLRLL